MKMLKNIRRQSITEMKKLVTYTCSLCSSIWNKDYEYFKCTRRPFSTGRSLNNRSNKNFLKQYHQTLLVIHRNSSSSPDYTDRHSVHVLCKEWTKKFEENGKSEPGMSADLIIAHVTGKKMINEVCDDILLEESLVTQINELCQQRLQSIPVQYIIGEWDFHDLVLKMRKPVFVPRPETEQLAEFVCEHLQSKNLTNGRFLDIGCGSGAISLYLLNRLNKMTGVAVDKHIHACNLTEENAKKLVLEDRLYVHHLDICQRDIVQRLQQYLPFDVIVSNPPYIPSLYLQKLDPEIIRYEDRDALDGGEDGLDIIRQILVLAPKLLTAGGQLWLEVDLGEPKLIENIIKNFKSINYVKTLKDFTNRDRFCVLEVT